MFSAIFFGGSVCTSSSPLGLTGSHPSHMQPVFYKIYRGQPDRLLDTLNCSFLSSGSLPPNSNHFRSPLLKFLILQLTETTTLCFVSTVQLHGQQCTSRLKAWRNELSFFVPLISEITVLSCQWSSSWKQRLMCFSIFIVVYSKKANLIVTLSWPEAGEQKIFLFLWLW